MTFDEDRNWKLTSGMYVHLISEESGKIFLIPAILYSYNQRDEEGVWWGSAIIIIWVGSYINFSWNRKKD